MSIRFMAQRPEPSGLRKATPASLGATPTGAIPFRVAAIGQLGGEQWKANGHHHRVAGATILVLHVAAGHYR
jgi:hypothetical protein